MKSVAGIVALVIVAGLAGTLVGRSTAPDSVTATTRQAQADVGLDRLVPDLNFSHARCVEVFAWLQEQTKANIAVNWRALEAAGIDQDAKVTLRLTGLPLRRVIELVCDQIGGGTVEIGFEVDRGVIVVNTDEQLARTSIARIYDVRDLLKSGVEWRISLGWKPPTSEPGTTVCFPSKSLQVASSSLQEQAVEELTRLITEIVNPDSWRDAGGTIGSIREFSGRFVIVATPSMHADIESLLGQLRERK